MIPMLIIPIQSLPIVYLTDSIWNSRDCIFKHSESVFNNTIIFEIWFKEVFLNHINEVRKNLTEKNEKR
mgnify:FL=1